MKKTAWRYKLIMNLAAVMMLQGLSVHADTAPQDSRALNLRVAVFTAIVGRAENPFEENVYLVVDTDSQQCLIVDPGAKCPELEAFIAASNLTVVGILNTHGHGDHKGANGLYRARYSTKVIAHETEKPYYANEDNRPTQWVTGDEQLNVGVFTIQVLHTPGHSPGSACYLIQDHLFSGDTLFEESIGRTRDDDVEKVMIGHIRQKLLVLPPETIVYPGHGLKTTIGAEKENNPYL